MKNIFILLLIILLANYISYSQTIVPEVVASSGDQYSDSINIISWTLGEILTETYTGNSQTLTQGFHQPIIEISSIDDLAIIKNICIYPNPTAEQLSIECPIKNLPLQIELLDMNGKQLLTKEWKQNSTYMLPMSLYSSGSYFLRIKSIRENKENTYTVVKK